MNKPVAFSVHEFDLEPKKLKDLHKPKEHVEIWDYFAAIESYKNFEKYIYLLHKGQLRVHLRKISLDKSKKQAKLLIVISDKDARNRSFTDTETGDTRLTDKKETEGDDCRIHLVFYVVSKYKAILGIERERGSGINSNLVRVFFNNLIEYIRENEPDLPLFYEDHPSGFREKDGSYIQLHRTVTCNVDNRFSNEILNAFKMGKINNLQLIYKETHNQNDNLPFIRRKKSQLHFDIDSQFIPNQITDQTAIQNTIKQRLNKISDWFKTEEHIPISEQVYRIEYSDDQGYPHNVTYSPSEGLDLLFAKTFKLDPKVFKFQAWEKEPKINDSLCDRALIELKRS
ncbi:hypothetical protein [Acinetobacter lwoffii]|uniref:hypothetical protein n=1 Tax=Acinetobacter lwoffii TaxID=28090 RepID=UPI00110CBD5F|nr:hypothetical protein [Acinetobacter lwoffii]TMS40553.1 hypothetical protein FGQ54_18480 [Acinetobacter lwoffii]